MNPTRNDAINLLAKLSLAIDMILPTERERASSAAIIMAQQTWKLLNNRANSSHFKRAFGDLRRLHAQLTNPEKTSVDQ